MSPMAELLAPLLKKRWTADRMAHAAIEGEFIRRQGWSEDLEVLAAYDKKLARYKGKVWDPDSLDEWMDKALDEVTEWLLAGDPDEWHWEIEGALTDVEEVLAVGLALCRIKRLPYKRLIALRDAAISRMFFLRPEITGVRCWVEDRIVRLPDTTLDQVYGFWRIITDPLCSGDYDRLPLSIRKNILDRAVARFAAH